MNTNTKSRPTNYKFKATTGLDIEYLKGLTNEEVIQLFDFLTQTSAGQKFAVNASKKNKRLQVSNRRLGQEKKEVIDYADKTINIIKNESDQKLINISEAVKALFGLPLFNKPLSKIEEQDIKQVFTSIQDILTLIQHSLWS